MGVMTSYLDELRKRRSPVGQSIGTTFSALPPQVATKTDTSSFGDPVPAAKAKLLIDQAIADAKAAEVEAINPGIATAMEKPKPSRLMPLNPKTVDAMPGGQSGPAFANMAPTEEELMQARAQDAGRSAGPIETGLLSAANSAALGMPAAQDGPTKIMLETAKEKNPVSGMVGDLAGALLPFGISGTGARLLIGQATKLGLTGALERVTARLGAQTIGGRAVSKVAAAGATEALTGAIYAPLSHFAQGGQVDKELLKKTLEDAITFAALGSLFSMKGATKQFVSETRNLIASKRFKRAMDLLRESDEAAYTELRARADQFMNPTVIQSIASGAKADSPALLSESSMVPKPKGEAGLKTGSKPAVPEEVDLSLENIKGMSDANLRNELVRLGQDPAEIAKLSKDELLFRVSGGRLGADARTIDESLASFMAKTKPEAEAAYRSGKMTAEEVDNWNVYRANRKPPKPPDSPAGGVPVETKPMEPVAPAMTPEQQAIMDRVKENLATPPEVGINPAAVKIGKQLGLRYDGANWDTKDKLIHTFTDEKAGFSIHVQDLKKTKDAWIKKQAEEAEKLKQAGATSVESQQINVRDVNSQKATPSTPPVLDEQPIAPTAKAKEPLSIGDRYREAQRAFRAKEISEEEFLKVRREFDADQKAFDAARGEAPPTGELVSQGQRNLFYARIREKGLNKPETTELLKAHGIDSSAKIPKSKFDAVLKSIEDAPTKAKLVAPKKTTPKVEPKAPEGETATVRMWEGIPMRPGTEIVPLKDLHVRPEDMQMRGEAFSEKTAKSVSKGINANDWLPLQAWEDPKTKEIIVFDGHSRLKGLEWGNKPNAEVFVHRGISLEEAKALAMKSNFKNDPLDVVGKANAIRMVRDSGLKGEKLKTALEDIRTGLGRNFPEAEDLSYLDKNGLFMKLISNPGAVSETATLGSPEMKQFGRWVGEMRKAYPNSLTNQHENQIYKWFSGMSAKERGALLAKGAKGRQRVMELLEKQITDPTFKKESVLVFKGMDEPIVGAAASPNEAIRNAYARLKEITADIEKTRADLKAKNIRIADAGDVGVDLKNKIAEREKLMSEIGKASDEQGSLSLVFAPIGAVHGIEKDDEGNYRYNVGKGLAGMAHSVAIAGVIGAGLKYGAKAMDIGRTIAAKSRLASMEGRMLSSGGKTLMREFQDDVLRWQGAYAGRLLRYVADDFKTLKKADAKAIGQALLKGERPADERLGQIYDNIEKMHQVTGRLMRKTAGPTPQRDLFLQNDSPFQMREKYGMTHSLTRDARDAIEADLNIILSEVAPKLAETDIKRTGMMNLPLGVQAQHSVKIQDAVGNWLKRNQESLSEEMKSVIAHNEARGVNAPETVMAIRKHLGDNVALYRQFGPFHESRSIEFPIQLLEDDVREIIPRYVEGATREIALTRKYGWGLPKFQKALDDLALNSSWDAQQAAKTMLIYSGGNDIPKWLSENPVLRAVFEEASALQYFRLSPRSTLIQATQPVVSFLEDLGYTNFAKAVAKLPTEGKDVARRIYNSGVMDVDVLHSVGADNFGWRTISKAVPIYLKQIMFRQANRALQFTAGLAGDRALRDLYKIASKEKGIASERANYLLSHYFGIDAAKPLSEREMERGIFKYVTNSQLQKNITKETALMSSPTGRRLFTLLKFPLRQAKYQKDLIIAHARATRKIGGVGAVLPILRLAAGGFIAGEAYIYLMNKMNSFITGETRFRADKPLGEIWDDPSVRDIVIHALNNYTAIGSAGLFTDVLRVEPSEEKLMVDLKRNVFGLFLIPVVEQAKSGVEKAIKLANDIFIAQTQDKSADELAKRIGKDAYDLLFPGAASMTPGLMTEEEKNKKFKNRLGTLKRLGYDKQAGDQILKEIHRPGVSIDMKVDLVEGERTRMRKMMFEKALAGDIKGARSVAERFNAQFGEYLTPNRVDDNGKLISGTKLMITPKILNAYRKDRMAGQKESKTTSQIRQRVMRQEAE